MGYFFDKARSVKMLYLLDIIWDIFFDKAKQHS